MIVASYLLYGGDPLPVVPPTPVRPAFAKLPASVLDGYAGAYVFDGAGRLNVLRRGDHLLVNELGDGVITYFPVGGDAFIPNTEPGHIKFGRDSDGRVVSATVSSGSTERRASRLQQ